MNVLDGRILEIKGYREAVPGMMVAEGATLEMAQAYPESQMRPMEFWSQSDAKALELVDEATAGGADFTLSYNSRTGQWTAVLGRILIEEGVDQDRAEAICKAWIAYEEGLKLNQ